MPLGSIAEWRARIGSSWCALGRPFKTRSPFRGGAGRLQTPLTLNQVVTMMTILVIVTAINLALRIVWTTASYRAYLGEYPVHHQYTAILLCTSITKLLTKLFLFRTCYWLGVSGSHNPWSTLFVPISILCHHLTYTLAARYTVILWTMLEYFWAIK